MKKGKLTKAQVEMGTRKQTKTFLFTKDALNELKEMNNYEFVACIIEDELCDKNKAARIARDVTKLADGEFACKSMEFEGEQVLVRVPVKKEDGEEE